MQAWEWGLVLTCSHCIGRNEQEKRADLMKQKYCKINIGLPVRNKMFLPVVDAALRHPESIKISNPGHS